MSDHARGKTTDELEKVELVVDLADEEVTDPEEAAASADPDRQPPAEDPPRKEIRLSREQTLADLRDLQELTIERSDGRSPSED